MTPMPDLIGLLCNGSRSFLILPQGVQLCKRGKTSERFLTAKNPPHPTCSSHFLSQLVPVKPPSAMLNMNRCFMAFLCRSSGGSLSVSPFCSITISFFSSSFFSSVKAAAGDSVEAYQISLQAKYP